jgi:long-chain acyl-CoA synthetase
MPDTVTGSVIVGERRIASADILENGRRAATGMARLGVREGDAVALLMRNDTPILEATQGARLLGAYAVPINWHLKSEEVAYILADCDAPLLVAHADLLNALQPGAIPAGMTVLVVPTPPEAQADFHLSAERAATPAGARTWADWVASFEPWSGAIGAARPSMLYTSGTTGRPKGVRRAVGTPEQVSAAAAIFQTVLNPRPGMRGMVCGPMYHSSPNTFVRECLARADLFVLQSRFDPERTLADIERHRITHLVMVPTMFIRLVRLPEEVRRRYDLSSVERVLHTAAPCPPEVKRTMIAWWGPVIYEVYGSTEVGPAVGCSAQEWLEHPGTVGRPTPGTTVRIYDEEGRALPDGEVGEIHMRCSAYADFTYHKQPERRAAMERDGLVSVGDIGFMRDGYLYVCDRKVDMVIVGGVNIYPAEIESVLIEAPGVRDCAVFGVPDEEMGESLVAAVELQPDARVTEQDLKAYLASRLANYKTPRRIEFHAALPREESGKIFKRKLRDPHWAGRGRTI